jgi:hypothetical protein
MKSEWMSVENPYVEDRKNKSDGISCPHCYEEFGIGNWQEYAFDNGVRAGQQKLLEDGICDVEDSLWANKFQKMLEELRK